MTLYGDCETVPTPETEPCRPDSYYGITKHAAERYVHATAERPDLGFDFRVTSLRMFSVYGPGQSFSNPYQGVLGIFSGNLLRGEPITIFGDGEQTRDFVYIDDIVDGWVRALNTPAAARRRVQSRQRPVAVDQPARRRAPSPRSATRPAATRSTAPRHGRASSARVQADIRQAKARPRLGAADDFRGRARARPSAGRARSSRAHGAAVAAGQRCAMKLLLVTWVDPWTRSVSTVHKYVAAGRALGHEVAVYGPAACGAADAAVHDRPGRRRPRPVRRSRCRRTSRTCPISPACSTASRASGAWCVDLWGRFNDTIRLEHDFNHLEKLDGHLGWEWEDAIRAVSDTILQPTLAPLPRRTCSSFLFHGYDPGSVAKPLRIGARGSGCVAWTAEKPYGVMYVGSNWQRWEQVAPLPRRLCAGPRARSARPAWSAGTGARGRTGPCRSGIMGIDTDPACSPSSTSRCATASASMRSSACSARPGSRRCSTGRCSAIWAS